MPTRLVVIGCDGVAGAHFKAANALPTIDQIFAVDSDHKRAQQAATEHNVAHHSTD